MLNKIKNLVSFFKISKTVIHKDLNKIWLIPLWVLVLLFFSFIIYWKFFSYDENLYFMDFFKMLDPYILNFWFLFYWWVFWYILSITDNKIRKNYMKDMTILLTLFITISLFITYFVKWYYEDKNYISENSVRNCLSHNMNEELEITNILNVKINELIWQYWLDINKYNIFRKDNYLKKVKDIKCHENDLYCNLYIKELSFKEQITQDYNIKCLNNNIEKLWTLSWIKSEYINNIKYYNLEWIKNFDMGNFNNFTECIEIKNENNDYYKCLEKLTSNP